MVTQSSTVGELLRGLRGDRGLSIRALARGSGVSKSALSQWESHGRSPSIYELDQVLTALEAPSPLRLRAYALVEAPRGDARIEEVLFEGPVGPSVLSGALLRAIRRRAGKTQEQVAQTVGVTQAAVAQWESGLRRRDTHETTDLCQALGASVVEAEALSGWQPSLEHLENLLFPNNPSIEGKIGQTLFEMPPDAEFILKDLKYAVIGARLWSDASHGGPSRELMSNLFACYASHLILVGDDSMASRFVDRAYRMADRRSHHTDSRVFIIKAEMMARTGNDGRRKALSLLESYLPSCANPYVVDWVRSVMAGLLFDLDDPDSAIDLATEAYHRECDLCGCEARFRLRELARLLIRAHRVDEAIEHLGEWEATVDRPYHAVEDDILLAEVRHAAGDVEGSLRALDDARNVVVAHSYSYLLPQIDTVERRLANNPRARPDAQLR